MTLKNSANKNGLLVLENSSLPELRTEHFVARKNSDLPAASTMMGCCRELSLMLLFHLQYEESEHSTS